MPTPPEVIRDAQELAEFANRTDAAELLAFRENYPDFLSWTIWDATGSAAGIADTTPEALQAELRKTWKNGFPIEDSLGLLRDSYDKLDRNNFPFQRAVMLLTIEPWRAKYCVCGNHFVADLPNRRFCSDKCFQQSRKRSKRAWWQANVGAPTQKAKNPRSNTRARKSPR